MTQNWILNIKTFSWFAKYFTASTTSTDRIALLATSFNKPLVNSMCSCRHCPMTKRGGFPLNMTIRAGHLRVFVDIRLHRQSTRLVFSFITMNRTLSTVELRTKISQNSITFQLLCLPKIAGLFRSDMLNWMKCSRFGSRSSFTTKYSPGTSSASVGRKKFFSLELILKIFDFLHSIKILEKVYNFDLFLIFTHLETFKLQNYFVDPWIMSFKSLAVATVRAVQCGSEDVASRSTRFLHRRWQSLGIWSCSRSCTSSTACCPSCGCGSIDCRWTSAGAVRCALMARSKCRRELREESRKVC